MNRLKYLSDDAALGTVSPKPTAVTTTNNPGVSVNTLAPICNILKRVTDLTLLRLGELQKLPSTEWPVAVASIQSELEGLTSSVGTKFGQELTACETLVESACSTPLPSLSRTKMRSN